MTSKEAADLANNTLDFSADGKIKDFLHHANAREIQTFIDIVNFEKNPRFLSFARLALDVFLAEQQAQSAAKSEKQANQLIFLTWAIVGLTVTTSSWTQFVSSLEGTGLQRGDKMHLHQNLWLIPLETDMIALTKLVHRAEAAGIPIRVLFLAEAPNWIKSPPDARESSEV